ncbi:ankyrin repeat-containing domain protein [Choanephora cucurbitarum]|nr:ankyrin repeat-containing domain protein [Choanephora cucurbitarum]
MKVPTSQDNLWIAAGDGQFDRVRELVEGGQSVNSHDEFGYTALHAAVSYNQYEIVEYLIQKGANVNIEDLEKDTPLYVAETVKMAQLLLDHGADPKHVNDDGYTPAMTASEEGWNEVAQLLAGITQETLPSANEEEEQEEDTLAHVQEAEDHDEFYNAHLEEIMKRIEEQGGVQDEEELREMVTKMVLEGMQRNINEQQ